MEWADDRGVIVFNYGEPCQRLMGWLLRDSQIPAEITDHLEQTLTLARTGSFPVLVLNSTAPARELAEIVREVRQAAELRIIVLHGGPHDDGEDEVLADVCIHDISDPDALVEIVRTALKRDLPVEEPHHAADQLLG